MKNLLKILILVYLASITSGCDTNRGVVSNVSEKEANVILVLLKSKGIPASKVVYSSGGGIGKDDAVKYSVVVPGKYSIAAIACMNQNGFPREKGTTLLDLFAKQGLMSSDKEETIRYQAGLAQQLTNTIKMIDGVIDANVQLSFPSKEEVLPVKQEGEAKERITAAVYVKHQGVIEDPNIHLENKIKRLVSGSVSGLDINDVTVVSDRSRFTNVLLEAQGESIGRKPNEYVSVWSIVISKDSAARFRFLFFFITFLVVILSLILGWLIWKFYPTLKKKGALKELFHPIPFLHLFKKHSSGPPGQGGT